ncbi:MAG: galactokinase [Candidatus Helarchaeota archaeon]
MNKEQRINLVINELKKFADFRTDNMCFIRAPGRVNLVGGHTDYNLGFVLPCAVDKDIIIGSFPINNKIAQFVSLNFNNTFSFDLNDFIIVKEHWVNYIKGIIYGFTQSYLINGMRGIIHGEIPMGGGMGSSGAYEIAIALTIKHLNKIKISNIDLIKICYYAEKDFLGIETGIMDQFTSLFGQKDAAICIDCKTLNYEILKIPSKDIKLLVVNSNVKRAAKEALNQRKIECTKAVELLKNKGISINSLRDLNVEDLKKYKHLLSGVIFKRAKHIVYENERVLTAKNALKEDDLMTVGKCMKESHISLRDNYEVSCKELDIIFKILNNLEGVYGARMTGAGFGGCVVALIDLNYENRIIPKIEEEYKSLAGKKATIYSCKISDGASKLNIDF